jgi:hypothetical protein
MKIGVKRNINERKHGISRNNGAQSMGMKVGRKR